MARRPDDQDPQLSIRFAERLRRWREAAHITQRDLAFFCDTAETNIRRYEGGVVPGADILERIATALGRRMDELTSKAEPAEHPSQPVPSMHFKVRRPEGMTDEAWAAYEPRAMKEAEAAKRKMDALRDEVAGLNAAARKKR